MFNSLEKAIELINNFREFSRECIYSESYTIEIHELVSICEDYIIAQQCCDNYSKEIESLRNYIRLLENENKQLTHQHEDKGE